MTGFDDLFNVATKEQLWARIALDGPTGSGKTYTALTAAFKMVGEDGKVAVIDTERGSAKKYAHLFPRYGHRDWKPPYDPNKLAAFIRDAAQAVGEQGVLIIDSMSHFWQGEGGTLDIVDRAGSRAQGNKFAGWKEGTPAQNAMVEAILAAPCHVIVCMRSKMEYVLEKDERTGKTQPKRIGMAPIQREGVEFEFDLVLDLNNSHEAIVSKTRCDTLDGRVIRPHGTPEWVEPFMEWLSLGEKAAPEPERASQAQRDAVVEALAKLPNTYAGPFREARLAAGLPAPGDADLTPEQADALLDLASGMAARWSKTKAIHVRAKEKGLTNDDLHGLAGVESLNDLDLPALEALAEKIKAMPRKEPVCASDR